MKLTNYLCYFRLNYLLLKINNILTMYLMNSNQKSGNNTSAYKEKLAKEIGWVLFGIIGLKIVARVIKIGL
jgi:hypothetical protein